MSDTDSESDSEVDRKRKRKHTPLCLGRLCRLIDIVSRKPAKPNEQAQRLFLYWGVKGGGGPSPNHGRRTAPRDPPPSPYHGRRFGKKRSWGG